MTDSQQGPRRAGLRWGALALIVAAVAAAAYIGSSGPEKTDGADAKVTTMGTVEVTAELVDIRGLEEWKGSFPSNDLGYDYAYVMKYRVLETHRGEVEGDTLYVAHYNPLLPRSKAADDRPGCEEIGGDLERFRVGDLHRMALEVPLDDYYMGGLFNKYKGEVPPEALYWAVWTNRVVR